MGTFLRDKKKTENGKNAVAPPANKTENKRCHIVNGALLTHLFRQLLSDAVDNEGNLAPLC